MTFVQALDEGLTFQNPGGGGFWGEPPGGKRRGFLKKFVEKWGVGGF